MAKFAMDAALVIGGIALAATGVGALAMPGFAGVVTLGAGAVSITTTEMFAAAAALTVASQALAKKPTNAPSPTAWKADPQAGIPYAMGQCYLGGNIVYRMAYGDSNKYQTIVTVLSGGGPHQSIDTLYVDNVARGINGQEVQIPDLGYMYTASQLGQTPEAANLNCAPIDPYQWTAACKLSGYAATIVTLKYDTKGSHTMTSTPQLGWFGKWAKCYDPRKDSTVAGGNGAHRVGDETTWEWTRNAYCQAYTWLIGRHDNGKLVLGVGLDPEDIIVAQFIEGANVADANGWTSDGVVYSTDDPWDAFKRILQAGGGQPLQLGAQIGCLINTPRVSLATITAGDLAGDYSVQTMQARKDRINAIVPRYVGRQDVTTEDSDGNLQTATTWDTVPAGPIVVDTYVAEDGEMRQKEIEYSFVTGDANSGNAPNQVAQLARYDIENAREFGPITLNLKLRWLGYRPGDVLTVDIPEIGLVNQDILIMSRDFDPATGLVTFTARSETSAKHAFALGQTTTAPSTPSIWIGTGSVAAPLAASWTAQGAQLSNLGTSMPVIAVEGAVDNGSADAVILEYRVSQVLGTADGSDLATGAGDTLAISNPGPWIQAGIYAPNVTGMQIAQVASGENYDVAVSYRVRGVIGAQLIIPSVQAGLMVTPGSLASLIATSAPSSALSMTAAADANGTTATISISAHQRVYSDKTVNVSAGSITGLALSTYYVIFYDDPTRAGGAVTYQASTNPDDALITSTTPARHYVGAVTTPAAGSTSTSSGTTATGAGGLSTTTGTKKQQV